MRQKNRIIDLFSDMIGQGLSQGVATSPDPALSVSQHDPEKLPKTDRPHAEALNLAADLMKEHGLGDWRIKLDHARRRAGQCDYNKKEISLSRHYVRYAEMEHIRDTILHEIAHALVGPNHGHDAVWRQQARAIGCTATRCHTLNFSHARWIMRCPNGCFEVERHRRKSGLLCATCKSPVVFESRN